MGFRHRRSFKIAPGVKINVGKKSASVTFGGKHTPHYTVNSKGRKTVSTKTPVKGVSYSKSWSSSSNSRKNSKGKSNYSSSKSSNSYYSNNSYNETETNSNMTIMDRVDAIRHNAKYRVDKLNTWSKNHKVGSAIFLVIVSMISASLFYSNVIAPTVSNDESYADTAYVETTEESTTRASLTKVEKETTTEAVETTSADAEVSTVVETTTETSTEVPSTEKGETVYVTPSGEKYHRNSACGGKNSYSTDKASAVARGKSPCKKCYG